MNDYYKLFSNDLKLKSYASRSIQSYLRSLRGLQNFLGKSLEEITEDDIRGYWLFCKDELKWGSATFRVSYSAAKLFFIFTLKRDWSIFREIKLRRDQTSPEVLSVDEVRSILQALPEGRSRTFYETLYSLGLRLSEALNLRVVDIDSERMLVAVRGGKGGKDRLIPLPETTLRSLREYWKSHRNAVWLFPAPGRDGEQEASAVKPVSKSAVQGALKRTIERLGTKKHVHPHTFRHSYATHLIEAGVPIRHVQEYLGHKSLTSTMVYLHLTSAGQSESISRINQLTRGVVS